MLKPFPEKSREQRIRDELESVGGMSTSRFARHCIDAGVWSGDELDAIQLRGVQAEIRKVLKTKDSAGLPFAGQTTESDDDGGPIWRVRQMWLLPDYEMNVRELVSQRDLLHWEAVALVTECRDRFGVAPSLESIATLAAAD